MKYQKAATQRNTAQLLLNYFLCCVKLRAGSLVIACANVVICVVGIWHSLLFGEKFNALGSTDISTVHYIWTGISVFSLAVTAYLLICLLKKHWQGINVWIIWNGFVLILRLIVIVLIWALNIDNQIIIGNICFHVIASILTIYFILVLVSFYQQITLTHFGYYNRYHYPIRRFHPMLMLEESSINSEGEYKEKGIAEEFV